MIGRDVAYWHDSEVPAAASNGGSRLQSGHSHARRNNYTAARDGAQALFVSQGPFFNAHRAELAERAQRARLPAIYGFREFAFAGGMMSYGPSLPAVYQRFATLVEKIILKGEKPGNLPIEVPTRFELVINLKAANAINLDIPEAFLIRADEVIE